MAKDVLRHRLILTYEALAQEISADEVLDQGFRGREGPGDRTRTGGERMMVAQEAKLKRDSASDETEGLFRALKPARAARSLIRSR